MSVRAKPVVPTASQFSPTGQPFVYGPVYTGQPFAYGPAYTGHPYGPAYTGQRFAYGPVYTGQPFVHQYGAGPQYGPPATALNIGNALSHVSQFDFPKAYKDVEDVLPFSSKSGLVGPLAYIAAGNLAYQHGKATSNYPEQLLGAVVAADGTINTGYNVYKGGKNLEDEGLASLLGYRYS